MTRRQIAKLIESAIDRLVKREPQLLDLDVAERALSHHLARYIAELVPPEFDVDCEYNRHLQHPKRLNLPRRRALDREIRATTVFPDIIVHKRNTDSHNLLVLEIKKPGEDIAYDEIKLRAFRTELGYAHCAHVILGLDNGTLVRKVQWLDDPAT